MAPDTTIRRLPDLTLPSATGATIPLRSPGREGTVLLLTHSAECPGCAAYLRRLAGVQEQLRDWDGRVVVVTPDLAAMPEAGSGAPSLPFPILRDVDGCCTTLCGVGGGSMIIADQWGEVFHVHSGKPGMHDFPAPAEVVEWLRFVAIQCPECQGEAW